MTGNDSDRDSDPQEEPGSSSAAASGLRLFGDDPTDGTGVPDLLDRLGYAGQVIALLDRVREQSVSSVLALIGPWGSGKSSVLQMTLRLLAEGGTSEVGWHVAEFNPWNYPDLDSLQTGFFAELRSAMPDGSQWSESRKRIGEVGKALSPLGKLTGLVGLDASTLLDKFSALVAGDTSVTRTHKEAARALELLDRPILMVLDDLDRLTPDELLRTLKLVRLVGRLPNVYYLLCYDERTLLDVLQRTDLVGEGGEARARDYMEKIVQVRLDVPPLRSTQASELFDKAYDVFLSRYEVQLTESETQRLARVYWDCLHKWLDTPRSINRFAAQLDAFYGAVRGEVDVVDYTLVTWLRTARPGLYLFIQGYRSELTMTDMTRIFVPRNPEDERNVWRERLQNEVGVKPEELDDMLYLLDALFAAVHTDLSRVSVGDSTVADIATRRGVGHIDYFDRYFAFGIPTEDLADGDVVEALRLLAVGEGGEAIDRLVESLAKDTMRTVRKMENAADPEVAPAVPLLRILAGVYGDILKSPRGLISDPRRAIEFYAERLMRAVDRDAGPKLLRFMGATDAGLNLAAWAIARVCRPPQEGASEVTDFDWQDAASETVVALTTARFEQASADNLHELGDEVRGLIWPWYHLDKQSLRAWLADQVRTDRWPLLDALACLVSVGTASTGGRTFETLGDVDLELVDALFGMDYVLSTLAAEIDAALESTSHRYEMQPTWENRRALMLQALKARRDRAAAELKSDEQNDDN